MVDICHFLIELYNHIKFFIRPVIKPVSET
jgi:hypothetical protein